MIFLITYFSFDGVSIGYCIVLNFEPLGEKF